MLMPYGASWYLSDTHVQCILSGQQAFEGVHESCFSSPPLVSTILAVYSRPLETLRAQRVSLALREAFRRNSRKKSSPRSYSLRANLGSALAPPIQNSSFLHEDLGLGQAQKPELGKHTHIDSS